MALFRSSIPQNKTFLKACLAAKRILDRCKRESISEDEFLYVTVIGISVLFWPWIFFTGVNFSHFIFIDVLVLALNLVRARIGLPKNKGVTFICICIPYLIDFTLLHFLYEPYKYLGEILCVSIAVGVYVAILDALALKVTPYVLTSDVYVRAVVASMCKHFACGALSAAAILLVAIFCSNYLLYICLYVI